jgi:hypothetical protein
MREGVAWDGETYLVAHGDDGNKYWAYCRKYSDDHETAFKAKVKERSEGIEIEL